MEYLFLFLAIIFSSLGQIQQKKAADILKNSRSSLLQTVLDLRVILAVVYLGLGVITWIAALTSIPLSVAYPFMSISVVLIMAYAVFFLKESVKPQQWLGAGLIMLGLSLVSAGG